MRKEYSKNKSLFIVALIYISAAAVSFAAYYYAKSANVIVRVFLADIAATLAVWLFGLVLRNSSVYDPYWSVAPLAIVPAFLALRGTPLSFVDILLLCAVVFWGVRLTLNWVVGWKGLSHADWRYDMLKAKNPKLWFVANLFGINLMPTVLVYIALFPAYFIIAAEMPISKFSVIGFAICIAAAAIQLASDSQMKRHRQFNPDKIITAGLWKYSRHPNYFGEVAFWWGLFIMSNSTYDLLLMRMLGALLMTALFIFISIPMMERHLEARLPEYNDYKSKVSMIVPWFKRG